MLMQNNPLLQIFPPVVATTNLDGESIGIEGVFNGGERKR